MLGSGNVLGTPPCAQTFGFNTSCICSPLLFCGMLICARNSKTELLWNRDTLCLKCGFLAGNQVKVSPFHTSTHLWTFGAENTFKSWPFQTKNKALIFPKKLQNNFENRQNTTFLTTKMAKSRMPILQKVPIFGSIFALRALFMALLW